MCPNLFEKASQHNLSKTVSNWKQIVIVLKFFKAVLKIKKKSNGILLEHVVTFSMKKKLSF